MIEPVEIMIVTVDTRQLLTVVERVANPGYKKNVKSFAPSCAVCKDAMDVEDAEIKDGKLYTYFRCKSDKHPYCENTICDTHRTPRLTIVSSIELAEVFSYD